MKNLFNIVFNLIITKQHGLVAVLKDKKLPFVELLEAALPVSSKVPEMNSSWFTAARLLEMNVELEEGLQLKDFFKALKPYATELGVMMDAALTDYVEASEVMTPAPSPHKDFLCVYPRGTLSRVETREYDEDLSFIEQINAGPVKHLAYNMFEVLSEWDFCLIREVPEGLHRYSVPMAFTRLMDLELKVSKLGVLEVSQSPSIPNAILNSELKGLNLSRGGWHGELELQSLWISESRLSMRELLNAVLREVEYPFGSEEREEQLMESVSKAMADFETQRVTEELDAVESSEVKEDSQAESKPEVEVAEGAFDELVTANRSKKNFTNLVLYLAESENVPELSESVKIAQPLSLVTSKDFMVPAVVESFELPLK